MTGLHNYQARLFLPALLALVTACGGNASNETSNIDDQALFQSAEHQAMPVEVEQLEPGQAAGDSGTRLDLNAELLEDARGVDIINGPWAQKHEDCANGFAYVFEGPLYYDHAGSGPWHAEGDTIVVEYHANEDEDDAPMDLRLKVVELTPDRMVWRDSGFMERELMLCP